MAKYKTQCCKSEYYRNGRADYRCLKCDKDVTIELVLYNQIENGN